MEPTELVELMVGGEKVSALAVKRTPPMLRLPEVGVVKVLVMVPLPSLMLFRVRTPLKAKFWEAAEPGGGLLVNASVTV